MLKVPLTTEKTTRRGEQTFRLGLWTFPIPLNPFARSWALFQLWATKS